MYTTKQLPSAAMEILKQFSDKRIHGNTWATVQYNNIQHQL
jgi:hypothetical protein